MDTMPYIHDTVHSEALHDKKHASYKVSENSSKSTILKSRFLREKIIFFIQVFFLTRYGSLRSIAHVFSIKSYNRRDTARNPCIRPYIFGNPLHLMLKTCAIERREPYLVRKKPWMKKKFRGEILILKL